MNPLLANSLKRFFSHYLPVQKGLSENTVLSYRDATKLLLCTENRAPRNCGSCFFVAVCTLIVNRYSSRGVQLVCRRMGCVLTRKPQNR